MTFALTIKTAADLAAEAQAERRAAVTAERDRRIDAGLVFDGVAYQTTPAAREDIAGAASLALEAILAGAQAGDLRWQPEAPDQDFAWIAADNTVVPMDAPTMRAFGRAVLAHKQAHIFAAKALKDAPEIPADFANDRHWPR